MAEENEEMGCECLEIHEDLLKIVNETMPDEEELYDLADLFKVFADSTRIRILFVLFEAEVCVCDGKSPQYDTVGSIPPASHSETEQTGKKQTRRKINFLFPG